MAFATAAQLARLFAKRVKRRSFGSGKFSPNDRVAMLIMKTARVHEVGFAMTGESYEKAIAATLSRARTLSILDRWAYPHAHNASHIRNRHPKWHFPQTTDYRSTFQT
jgi:hypothetical protein